LEKTSTCFGQFLCPSSGVFHSTHSNGICHRGLLTYTTAVCTVKNSWWWTEYRFADSLQAGSGCSILILIASCQQTCMTYTIAVCEVKNSWWWTEKLSETRRVSFQNKFEKLVQLVGLLKKICHDARSQERQKKRMIMGSNVEGKSPWESSRQRMRQLIKTVNHWKCQSSCGQENQKRVN
jgi:hypothetical protein